MSCCQLGSSQLTLGVSVAPPGPEEIAGGVAAVELA